jgi:hypothetical protein
MFSHASELAILKLMYSYELLRRVLFIHEIWDEICVIFIAVFSTVLRVLRQLKGKCSC